MRTFAIILLSALALSFSAPASALVEISLTQIGGSYSGPYAGGGANGETLVLQIDYAITGDSRVTFIGVALSVWENAGVLPTLLGATETGPALWENGLIGVSPTITGTDIEHITPQEIKGWGKHALAPWGTPGTCIYDTAPGGSCGTLGTVTFQINGYYGGVRIGSYLSPEPFGTLISDENFEDITASASLGTFTWWTVPEPTTGSLLGLGLAGLAAVARRRKR